MRNSNANNTILFSEKKKEFENSKDNHNFHDHKALKDKNAEIILLSSYKRLKFKKNHFKKEGHVDTNKNKLKNKIFLVVIIALFLLIFITTFLKQNSQSEVPSNTFVAQSSEINKSDSSAYKATVKKVVGKYTNTSYNVYVSELHQNGNLVYAQGYFSVPNEGNVNYDLIWQDNSPTSLIINGNEYIK
ncbi:hypothetical protein [Clostridium sp. 1001270J_160509_D11]|uniref:hypothetical protein n=2 Tax=Clostridia TaxID=186801 RepID=UPI0018A900A3|nr:hypothetical protein [Clostridium sp. 1001270J_160509_D11]